MRKKEVVAAVADRTGLDNRGAGDTVDIILEQISSALSRDVAPSRSHS